MTTETFHKTKNFYKTSKCSKYVKSHPKFIVRRFSRLTYFTNFFVGNQQKRKVITNALLKSCLIILFHLQLNRPTARYNIDRRASISVCSSASR